MGTMRRRWLLFAAVIALVASVLVLVRLARGPDQVFILIAKEELPIWSKIRNPHEEFDIQAIAKAAAPPNFVPAEQIEAIVGRRLKATIAKGTCLTEEDLGAKDIVPPIAPGKRAMAIKIIQDDWRRFFILPGNRVDVVQQKSGVYVVEDDVVLAIDSHEVPFLATLEVDPDQALKLTEAQETGTLTLVVHPPPDDEPKK